MAKKKSNIGNLGNTLSNLGKSAAQKTTQRNNTQNLLSGGSRQAPPMIAAPRAPQGAAGGGSVGGGGGGGGARSTAPISSAPGVADGALTDPGAVSGSQLPEEDYLAGDAAYQAQWAALQRALSDYDTDRNAQTTKYNTDFGQGLKDLGWMSDGTGIDQLATANGKWNETDQNTASGRSISNQLNDFASRGLIQSSLFAGARSDLDRSLNDQRTSLVKGRSDWLGDAERQRAAFANENTLSAQQARAEALARRAAGLSLG